ncbi:MAG: hypothetical protein CK426_08940 [Legionella sp.]|nr:MAG: hypothetical protein CK423_08990 [Legionella sp.]PJD96976.1 MAG: hypothetical protein CK426_08940 [Legionella sp.]
MNTGIKKIALTEQQSPQQRTETNPQYLSLVQHLEVQCTIRIGTMHMTLGQLKELQLGQVLSLEQTTDEPVDVLLHDKVIARGELMSHENYFAIQITEVCTQ